MTHPFLMRCLNHNLFLALGSKSRVASNASSQAPLAKVNNLGLCPFQVTTRKRANPTDAGTTSKKPNLGAPVVTVTLS
ncbi:hypothetical protein A2U01_0065494, partial [Trifolium medium]|nr:hypothetical protein [Trifolium medium]